MIVKVVEITPGTRQAVRPSLYTEPTGSGQTSQRQRSILGELDGLSLHRTNASKWALALISVTTVAIVAYGNGGFAAAEKFFQKQVPLPAKVHDVLPAQLALHPPAAQPTKGSVLPGTTEAVAPALVIADTAAAEMPVTDGAPDQPAGAGAGTMEPDSAVAGSAALAGQVLDLQKTDSRIREGRKNAASSISAGIREDAMPARERQAANSTVLTSKGSKDGDVDLIAALLNRVASRSPPAARDSGRKERKADSGHDIVVRNSADTTENLLNRCKSLGLLEGELCKLRICSGRWGVDPFCGESAQVSAINPL